jgi:hypothetical protein
VAEGEEEEEKRAGNVRETGRNNGRDRDRERERERRDAPHA